MDYHRSGRSGEGVGVNNASVGAYYDPSSKCIKYNSRIIHDATNGNAMNGTMNLNSFLEGTIVEINGVATADLAEIYSLMEPGKLFHGEILEIIDLVDGAEEDLNGGGRHGEEKNDYDAPQYFPSMRSSQQQQPQSQTLSRHPDNSTHYERTAEPLATCNVAEHLSTKHNNSTSTTRENLLEKQRQQQKQHILQMQLLFQKQQKQRQQLLHQLDQLSKQQQHTNEDEVGQYTPSDIEQVRKKMILDLEKKHEGELMVLAENQQKDQQDMMISVLDFRFGTVQGDRVVGGVDAIDVGRASASDGQYYDGSKVIEDERNKTKTSDDNNNKKRENKDWGGVRDELDRSDFDLSDAKNMSKRRGRNDESKRNDHDTDNDHATSTKKEDRRKHRDDQTEEKKNLDDGEGHGVNGIVDNDHSNTPSVTAEAAPSSDPASAQQQKQEEIKAVMRDRSLGREERQKKLATIRTRYSMESSAPNINAPTASGNDAPTIDEQRRSELQSVMKDRSLGREEKQKRMADIKAKYASMAKTEKEEQPEQPEQPEPPEPPKKEIKDSTKTSSFTKGGIENTTIFNVATTYDASNEIQMLQRQQMKRQKSRMLKMQNAKDKEPEEHQHQQHKQDQTAESTHDIDLSKPPMHEVAEECETTISKRKAIVAVLSDTSLSWQEQNKQIVKLLQKYYVPATEDDAAPPEATPDATPDENDGSIQSLIDSVSKNDPNLVEVDLDGKDLTREDETALFKALAQNDCVTTLSLRKNKIANEGAEELANALKDNSTLTHIYLEENMITSNGATGFIAVLRESNKTVQYLELNHNRVRSGLLQQIKKIVETRRPGYVEPEPVAEATVTETATVTSEAATVAAVTPVETETASSRWNRAGIKVATADILTKKTPANDTDPGPKSSQRRKVSIAAPDTTGADSASIEKEINMKDIKTNNDPIKKIIKRLEDNDPKLTILKLDGRKSISESNWEAIFDSLEDNTKLTHLSMARCGLDDEMVVSLVLALVENEDLVYLNLSSNKGLSDDTGKGFVKVFNQSNKTLKKLELVRFLIVTVLLLFFLCRASMLDCRLLTC